MLTRTADNTTPAVAQVAPSAAKVLIVEANRKDLRYYVLALEDQGYEVSATSSHAEGLRLLESDHFDFIILNQGSREFEGRPLLERAIQIDRETPVLVLARYLDMTCYVDAMRLGALDYFQKPLAPAQIVRLVRISLQTRSVAS